MRYVYRKKNSGLECTIHHSAVVGEYEGRERGGEEGECGKNEARFCHRVLAAASLGIPNGDILILNFRRGKTKNGGLRRRPHVEQKIGSGGIPRIGRQFVFEFSQRDHVHRLVVALQPSDALLISPDAATVHATTADSIHQLFLVLVRAGLAPEVLEYTRCFVRRGRRR